MGLYNSLPHHHLNHLAAGAVTAVLTKVTILEMQALALQLCWVFLETTGLYFGKRTLIHLLVWTLMAILVRTIMDLAAGAGKVVLEGAMESLRPW